MRYIKLQQLIRRYKAKKLSASSEPEPMVGGENLPIFYSFRSLPGSLMECRRSSLKAECFAVLILALSLSDSSSIALRNSSLSLRMKTVITE